MHCNGQFPTLLLWNLVYLECVNLLVAADLLLSLLMFLMKREHQIGVMLSEPQSCLCLIQSYFPSSFLAMPCVENLLEFSRKISL